MLSKNRYQEHGKAYIKGGVALVNNEEAKSPPIGVALGLSWLDGYNLAKMIKDKGVNSVPDYYDEDHIEQFIQKVENKSNTKKQNW